MKETKKMQILKLVKIKLNKNKKRQQIQQLSLLKNNKLIKFKEKGMKNKKIKINQMGNKMNNQRKIKNQKVMIIQSKNKIIIYKQLNYQRIKELKLKIIKKYKITIQL